MAPSLDATSAGLVASLGWFNHILTPGHSDVQRHVVATLQGHAGEVCGLRLTRRRSPRERWRRGLWRPLRAPVYPAVRQHLTILVMYFRSRRRMISCMHSLPSTNIPRTLSWSQPVHVLMYPTIGQG